MTFFCKVYIVCAENRDCVHTVGLKVFLVGLRDWEGGILGDIAGSFSDSDVKEVRQVTGDAVKRR